MDQLMANTDAAAAFRENVLELLRTKHVSQKELADAIGTSQPGVSRVLKGKENVTLPRAEKIADFLGVELSEILKLPQKVY